MRPLVRDLLVGTLMAVTLVALALGAWFLGLALGLVTTWQVVARRRGRRVSGVDQRAADREGTPHIR